MAGMTFEEFAGGPVERPTRTSRGPADFPSVSPAVQAERDVEARRLIAAESGAEQEFGASFKPLRGVPKGGEEAATQRVSLTGQPAASGLSFEEFAGTEQSTETPRKLDQNAVLQRTLLGLKRTGGEAAAIADLVLSVPGFLVNVGAQLGSTAIGVAAGEGNEAFGKGREIGRRVSEPLMNPLHKVLEMVKGGEFYEGALTTQGMTKFGEALDEAGRWTEAATGGRVSRDAVPMFVETLMAGSVGIGSGRPKPPIDPRMQKVLREHAVKLRDEAEAAIEAQAVKPEVEVARAPVQSQINDLLGIRTPEEQAKVTRQRRKDINEAFRRPAEGSDYVDIGESVFRADERLSNEARFREAGESPAARIGGTELEVPSPQTPKRIGQAEILRVLQKPGFERTAEDLLTLRRARKEGGEASPEALMLLSAAGIGAGIGMLMDEENALRGAVLGGATGIAALTPMLGRGRMPGSGGRRKEMGAVKGPGGMWHPEAVERLSRPLVDNLTRGVREDTFRELPPGETPSDLMQQTYNTRAKPLEDWTESRIKTYLNRYAGTEKDPLKDVEIPYGVNGRETIPWEEATDNSFTSRPMRAAFAGERGRPDFDPALERAIQRTPEDPVWKLVNQPATNKRGHSQTALTSYLSHVGDYLRQNVDPAKLQQYDLVRAVRETAANDARVAKEMAKAQAADTATLPVYKEYPDGFKWVELKLPEKLTEEQGKRVREATSKDPVWNEENLRDRPEGPMPYIAIDAQGKAIKNSYTQDVASGKTPEEAWLAGQLAREGNSMGHCVGGYCPSVASGESRIFSLRDQKGESHVTVEVSPPSEIDWTKMDRPETDRLPTTTAGDINQIKGKQNRAPQSKYLPYVQDFVKEGKWGEVGDLENTGLYPIRQRSGSAYPRTTPRELSNINPHDLRLEPGYYTEAEIRAAQEAAYERLGWDGQGPRNQRGSIDQRLIMGLGAIGLGGLVGSIWSEDPLSGAVLGALAGGALSLPGAKRGLETAVRGVDKAAGVFSTRLRNISESLWKRVAADYESSVMTNTHAALDKVTGWMKASTNLPKSQRDTLNSALFMRGEETARAVAEANKGNPKLVSGWREVQNVLKELGAKAQQLGRFRDLQQDYFPQRVKDFDGLRAALDRPVRERIEQALLDAERRMLATAKRGLQESERDAIINRMLRSHYVQQTYQPGYAKKRTVKEVTDALRPFYHSPQESLAITIMELVKDIEMAKMFGQDLVQGEMAGRKYVNVDLSIGNLLGREMAEGRIKADQFKEVEGLLKSRFGPGEKSPSGMLQNVRNLSYAGLLADLPSAAVQLGDPLMALYGQGLRSTMAAVARLATGRNKVSVKDFGLADHIAEEIAFGTSQAGGRKAKVVTGAGAAVGAVAGAVLADDLSGAIPGAALGAFGGYASVAGTAAALNKVLRQGVFKPIDMFGKNVHLNAALSKGQRLASGANGVKQLRAKYGEAYGQDFPQLVADLRAGDLTPLTRSYLFSELARFQPISRSEVPQMYLNHPNGRLMYQLKTFMLKQADVVRRDAYNEMKKGNVVKGLKNLTEFSLVLGLGGATAEVLKDWMLGREVNFEATDIAENVLKTFGWAKYVREKAERNPILAPAGVLVPAPVQIMDRIIAQDPKAVRYIPVVGELYYEWELGGREESELRRGREAKKSGREYDLSPRAEEYRERKRERARERRENQ